MATGHEAESDWSSSVLLPSFLGDDLLVALARGRGRRPGPDSHQDEDAILDVRQEHLLAALVLLPVVSSDLPEVLGWRSLLRLPILVVVRLGVAASVIGAVDAALLVVGIPLGAVSNKVAGIATLETARLGAVFLAHPPIIHASGAVVE